ncbi:MAG: phosphoribosylanthranilate isomerase [bacterium]|nr:phosphoribosylanthranilate isomerase [bacterium]
MKRPKVKICGITNIEDAQFSVKKGAHYLGFIFYEKSPRYVEPAKAGEIIRAIKEDLKKDLKKSVQFAGVFVNADKKRIESVIEEAGIDVVQFHGDESPEFTHEFESITIKAIRVKGEEDIAAAERYETDFILFDAYSKSAYGGTGRVFNWDLVKNYTEKDRLFLSGGINSSNVKEAVQAVESYAVDVSSGVEKEPGKKDYQKIDELFKALNS